MTKKKKITHKKMDHQAEDFFRRISHPEIFRKDLLVTSKQTLTVLKQIYVVKQLREAKKELIKQTENELKELKLLFQKIENLLPQYSKEELKKHLMKKKAAAPIIREEPKPVVRAKPRPLSKPVHHKREDSEIDKLNAALENIQSKLNGL